jgi:hypothetical protein
VKQALQRLAVARGANDEQRRIIETAVDVMPSALSRIIRADTVAGMAEIATEQGKAV